MNPTSLKGRSLLTWINFTPEEIRRFLDLSKKCKAEARKGLVRQRFRGKSLALLFEKPSTLTQAAFETAFGEEGGHPVFLSNRDSRLGGRGAVEDTARVLGRMFDAIGFCGFGQEEAEILAKYSGVPVYNGLTDMYHPTQALADIFTLEEEYGNFRGKKLVFVGDGRNEVARSLMVICSKIGAYFSIVAPRELWPDTQTRELCRSFAEETGASLRVSDEVEEEVRGADALYAGAWTSLGEEASRAEVMRLLRPYQVDTRLLALTGKPECVFLHCLPAAKGEEVSFDLFEGPASRVFEQAENRKHAVKAVLLATL